MASHFKSLLLNDPRRDVVIVSADHRDARRIAVPWGDTYTILVSGDETGGRYSIIDMHIAADAGPPPHRHYFEESFTLLEGDLEFTVRGQGHALVAGSTITVPSNAVHFFNNKSGKPARMICVCSPPGLEDFFVALGAPVSGRTASAPQPTDAEMAKRWEQAGPIATRIRMERVEP